jgi:hypothetical protein
MKADPCPDMGYCECGARLCTEHGDSIWDCVDGVRRHCTDCFAACAECMADVALDVS